MLSDTMSNHGSKLNAEPGYRRLPLSHNSADSQASALRLVLTLFPDWETADGKVEFIRFKEGITNTVGQTPCHWHLSVVADISASSS